MTLVGYRLEDSNIEFFLHLSFADRMFMHHHASNIFLTNAPMRAETKTDAEGPCYFSSDILHCSAGESEKESSPARVYNNQEKHSQNLFAFNTCPPSCATAKLHSSSDLSQVVSITVQQGNPRTSLHRKDDIEKNIRKHLGIKTLPAPMHMLQEYDSCWI